MTKNTTYKSLGDYIQLVDVRNKDLKVEKLLGLSVEKRFIASIANTIGTDMSPYKIISNENFVYIADTSRRGDKIAIALYDGVEDAIVSQAYSVFEITDKEQLCPDYLMMWFRRPEFDRYARFKSHGSAREIFDWATMCDVMIPIPSIEEQRKIVSEYQTLTKRIEINNQLITKLENTAKTIYRKMFVDGIDKENLPDGWRIGTLGEIGKYTNGIACQNYKTDDDESLPVLKIRELSQGRFDTNSNRASLNVPKDLIIDDGDLIFSWSATLLIDFWCCGKGILNQHLFKVTSETCNKWFLYLATKSHIESWKRMISAKATSMGHIKREDIDNAFIIIPSNQDMNIFDLKVSAIFTLMLYTKKEILKLTELQSLLLAKMG